MEKQYLNIKEAAERLKVDPATVRRRIKTGEYKAELKDGPYGKQYMISADQIPDQAQIITDVIPVTRQITVAEVERLFDAAIARHTEPLKEEIRQLRAELDSHYRRLDERIRDSVGQKKPKGLLSRISNLFNK